MTTVSRHAPQVSCPTQHIRPGSCPCALHIVRMSSADKPQMSHADLCARRLLASRRDAINRLATMMSAAAPREGMCAQTLLLPIGNFHPRGARQFCHSPVCCRPATPRQPRLFRPCTPGGAFSRARGMDIAESTTVKPAGQDQRIKHKGKHKGVRCGCFPTTTSTVYWSSLPAYSSLSAGWA